MSGRCPGEKARSVHTPTSVGRKCGQREAKDSRPPNWAGRVTAYLVTKDRDGNQVTIHEKNWTHVVTHHPEMSGMEDAVHRTISDPDLVSEAANDPRDPL